MSNDINHALNALFSEYNTNPQAFVDLNGFLDRVGKEYRDSTAGSRQSDIAAEKLLSAVEKAAKQAQARERGDVVNISQAAKDIFAQYKHSSTPSANESPHATLQAMTSQGTEVTVNAINVQRQSFTYAGAASKLAAGKGGTTFTLSDRDGGEDPLQMEYSVTFRRMGGQEQTFALTGNTVFREGKDGTIFMQPTNAEGPMTGSDDQDIMINLTNNNTVSGGGGDDIIFNLGVGARLSGDTGDDVIVSMGNNAQVDGGQGDDAIAILQDTLRAAFDKEEADMVKETDEKNTYKRPQFSQTVNVDAGDGDDSIVLAPTMYKSTISGGAGMDDLYANDMVHSTLDAGDGSDMVRIGEAIKSQIVLGGGSDVLTANSLHKSTVDAGDGSDSIEIQKAYMSSIDGGAGDDVIMVDEAAKGSINGGSGNDYIHVQEGGGMAVTGSAGDDFIRVDYMEGSKISGNAGNDFITLGTSQNGVVSGDDGNDRIWINNNNGTTVTGNAGDDEIRIDNATQSKIFGDDEQSDSAASGNDTILVKNADQFTHIDGGKGTDVVTNGTRQRPPQPVDMRI